MCVSSSNPIPLLTALKGPTVFPILYALILGRATHALLLWRLERGEEIGVLDVLSSSTSFTATIVSQFQLRAVSHLGLALVAVWALSPIGGQASLRQMGIGDTIVNYTVPFEYMVHSGYGDGFPIASRNKSRQPTELLNAIFNGAILAPAAVRSTPRDLWGNVKIPRVEYYELNNATDEDQDGWFDATDGKASTYTSIIGIPIALGTNASGYINHTLWIHTPYFHVNCTLDMNSGLQAQMPSLNSSQHKNTTDGTKSTASRAPTSVPNKSATQQSRSSYSAVPTLTPSKLMARGTNSSSSDFARQFVGTSSGILTQNERTSIEMGKLESLMLKYAANTGKQAYDYTLTCNVTGSYVETEIICPRSTSCGATRVRRSKLPHFPASWTLLDAHKFNIDMLGDFLNSSISEQTSVNLIDRYLSNPAMTIDPDTLNQVDKRSSPEDYSIRLGQLLNAYFTASNGLYTITGGINNNTVYRWDSNQTFIPARKGSRSGSENQLWSATDSTLSFNFTGDTNMRAKTWTVEGKRSTFTRTIIAHRFWVAVLSIASNVLILASLISPVLHHFLIKGPEVMVNISGLATRSNPHIPLPEGGTFAEASDRARMLKRVQVRFGDCESKASVGSLVIGAVDTNRSTITRIKRDRVYE